MVMMANDIAGNYQNPHPGKIFNSPGGPDVYDGVPVVSGSHQDAHAWLATATAPRGGPDASESFPGVSAGRQAAHAWPAGASWYMQAAAAVASVHEQHPGPAGMITRSCGTGLCSVAQAFTVHPVGLHADRAALSRSSVDTVSCRITGGTGRSTAHPLTLHPVGLQGRSGVSPELPGRPRG